MNKIYQVPNGKGFTSIEKMINTLKPEEIENLKGLEKEFNRGNNVYVYLCPYNSEINETIQLYWSLSESDAIDSYYLASEEI